MNIGSNRWRRDEMKQKDYLFGNAFQKYGKALRITRARLILLFVIVCVITPATNWMIPFSRKIIKNDIVWRY